MKKREKRKETEAPKQSASSQDEINESELEHLDETNETNDRINNEEMELINAHTHDIPIVNIRLAINRKRL